VAIEWWSGEQLPSFLATISIKSQSIEFVQRVNQKLTVSHVGVLHERLKGQRGKTKTQKD